MGRLEFSTRNNGQTFKEVIIVANDIFNEKEEEQEQDIFIIAFK